MRWSAIWWDLPAAFKREGERSLVESLDGGAANHRHGHRAEPARDELLVCGQILVDVPDLESAAGA